MPFSLSENAESRVNSLIFTAPPTCVEHVIRVRRVLRCRSPRKHPRHVIPHDRQLFTILAVCNPQRQTPSLEHYQALCAPYSTRYMNPDYKESIDTAPGTTKASVPSVGAYHGVPK